MVNDEFKLRWNFLIETFIIFLSMNSNTFSIKKKKKNAVLFIFSTFSIPRIKHFKWFIIQAFLQISVQQVTKWFLKNESKGNWKLDTASLNQNFIISHVGPALHIQSSIRCVQKNVNFFAFFNPHPQ